tara:strand:- start:2587 stop:3219 length:633 start_codon:yes stop_codon:yes gene_type:complete
MIETNKLQNIKALRDMLEGSHFTQTKVTKGYDSEAAAAERTKKRDVGETWEERDTDGNIIAVWTQEKGYRTKKSAYDHVMSEVRAFLKSYPNCLGDCKTDEVERTRLDERFRAKFGRCADCQFRFESRLKTDGTYKAWEQEQMLNNANAFFDQADKEIEMVVEQMKSGAGYMSADGKEEKWNGAPGAADQLLSEYYEYKNLALNNIQEHI